MKRLFLLLTLLWLVSTRLVFAADPWNVFQDAVKADPAGAVRQLRQSLQADGSPLRTGDSLVFAYLPDGPAPKSVEIGGDFLGWSGWRPMARFGDAYAYILEHVPTDARVEYKFRIDAVETLDPLNSVQVDNGVGGRNSVAVMPGYRGVEIPKPGAKVESLQFKSTLAANSRPMHVYTPPSYALDPTRRYPTLYVHDGGAYLRNAHLADIAEGLMRSGRIGEAIIVFVDPVDRFNEYARSAMFTRVVIEELVPFVDARWRTMRAASGRAVLGASMGGLIALHLAFTHPETFGGAASQSGALSMPDGSLLRDIERAPRKAVEGLYVDVGLYDLRRGEHGLLEVNREARGILEAKRYPLHYHEFSGGHNWTSWRDQLPALLQYLLGS